MNKSTARQTIDELDRRLQYERDPAKLATTLQQLAARVSIEHFRRRLQHETDPATRAGLVRRLVDEEMKLNDQPILFNGLSPGAHGTLLALQGLRRIRIRDEAVARELADRRFAKIEGNSLRITSAGTAVRPYEEDLLRS